MKARWLVLAGLAALQGCSLPPPTVFAVLEGGSIVFHIRESGALFTKIFGWDDMDYIIDRLWVIENGRSIIEYARSAHRQEDCSATETFPLRLGEVRCGFRWRGGRGQLKAGGRYAVVMRGHEVGEQPYCSTVNMGEVRGGEETDCEYINSFSYGVVGAFVVKGNGRIVNLRPSKFPDQCGAYHAEQGSVQEEWAKHCPAEPERERIEKERGAANEGADQQPD